MSEPAFTTIFVIILIVAFIALLVAIESYVIMWCWNYTMPYIFHLPEITVWHALAFNVLIWLLMPKLRVGN